MVLALDLAAADFALVKNHQPECSILLPEKENGKIAAAAAHFNEDLKTITGAALPIVRDDPQGNRITFVIRKPDSLWTMDNYTLTFPDPRTLQIEGTENSVQWAFNHILREYAKAEWILPENCGLSYTPMEDLTVPAQTVEVKDVSWPLSRTLSVHNMWWMQNLRDGTKISHEITTFAFPYAKYSKNDSWPEAVMPVLDGKKIKTPPDRYSYWQPCYSNPEAARIAVENILAYMKEHPDTLAVGLSVNDNRGYCECSECLKMDKEPRISRSESYYTFVNRVAEELCKTYPNLPVKVGAYDLTYQPPSFKLHPNVLVRLTIDFNSCVNPKIHEKHKRVIAEWGSKASMLGVWDYSWSYPYPMPRLYAPYHLDMLKFLHEHNGKAYDAESWINDAHEGPKHYLITKFLWNSKQDMKKLEEEWYVRCVGEKAAPYLKAYYKIWNDYFTGAVTKTPWFQSAGNAYMTYPDRSCVFALTEEDLRQAGEAMDQVVKLAETEQEKARAELMMRHWRLTFLRLSLLGAGIYDPQGMIHTPQQALKLLETVGKAQALQKEYDQLCKVLLKEKYLRHYYLSQYYRNEGGTPIGMNFSTSVQSHIIAAAAFAQTPEVTEKLKVLASDPDQPDSIRQICRVMLDPDAYSNLLPEGNAENGVPAVITIYPEGAAELTTTGQYKAEGEKSFQIAVNRNALLFSIDCKTKPLTTYLILFKAFIPEPSAEGYLVASFWRQKDGRNQEYSKPPLQKLSGGVWQTFALKTHTKADSDGIRLRVYMNEFEKEDKIFVDDIRLIEVGPAPAPK